MQEGEHGGHVALFDDDEAQLFGQTWERREGERGGVVVGWTHFGDGGGLSDVGTGALIARCVLVTCPRLIEAVQ